MDQWRELAVLAMFGYLGLGYPDIDLLLIDVLHHRSIVTHSVLLPACLLLLRPLAAHYAFAGFTLGISVHLAADVLSSPVGFGMVWLPWPVKVPLGPLSPVWLAANAILGLVWAKTLLWQTGGRLALGFFVVVAIGLGASYASLHEERLLSGLSFAVVFGTSFAVTDWLRRRRWFAQLVDADRAKEEGERSRRE